MKITVEIRLDKKTGNPDEVFVSFDREGLARLQQCLSDVNFKKAGDDTMLMSSEWVPDGELTTKEYHPGLLKAHKIEFQLMINS